MVLRRVSSVLGRVPEETCRNSRRCVLDVAFPRVRKLTNPMDLPPGSPNVGSLETSKYVPPGCSFCSLWVHSGFDAGR